VGDAVQPTAKRCRLADGTHLPDEDEKRGLEGVLGVGLIAEHAAADI
jgi:hypothetical protein